MHEAPQFLRWIGAIAGGSHGPASRAVITNGEIRKGSEVSQSLEEISEIILELRTELTQIRETYKGVSKSYVMALSALSDLTIHSSEAAKRAAKSTEQSKIAAMNAMVAAKEAVADPSLVKVVEAAVSAAIAAALPQWSLLPLRQRRQRRPQLLWPTKRKHRC
jgi:hypothetical protein